jgi:hypothetical protein
MYTKRIVSVHCSLLLRFRKKKSDLKTKGVERSVAAHNVSNVDSFIGILCMSQHESNNMTMGLVVKDDVRSSGGEDLTSDV